MTKALQTPCIPSLIFAKHMKTCVYVGGEEGGCGGGVHILTHLRKTQKLMCWAEITPNLTYHWKWSVLNS